MAYLNQINSQNIQKGDVYCLLECGRVIPYTIEEVSQTGFKLGTSSKFIEIPFEKAKGFVVRKNHLGHLEFLVRED